MCDRYAIPGDLRVSIQVRAAADLVSGHRASAILVESDALWIPDPPARFLDDVRDHAMEAAIMPFPLRPELLIERIRIPNITTFTVDGMSQPTLVAARLGARSRYAPQVSEFTTASLGEALESSRDHRLAAALVTVGAIPSEDVFAVEEHLPEADRIVNEQGTANGKACKSGSWREFPEDACQRTPLCVCLPADDK